MQVKHLIQQLVGTEEFVLEDVIIEPETNSIIIVAHPNRKNQYRCGICHKKCCCYDKGRGKRRWRCPDIGGCKVYIEAEAPRIQCKKHGIVTAYVPWARHNSRFCRNIEDSIAWLVTYTSKTVVAELMRVEWHTVGDICNRVYKELENAMPSRFDGLVNIGIDETSYKRGHKYMTVVINHDTSSVIWSEVGYGSEVLSHFFELLTLEQRASIRCVSADGARWIAACVEKYCPDADRCVDPFHVVSWATEALDKERRKAWAEAHRTYKDAPKRGKGRPAKGTVASPEKQQAREVKNARYALLKNPENLSKYQKAQLEFLTVANPRLYRAYLLKENLRLALKAGFYEISEALTKWMSWAQRCRIPEFRELRKKIKRNFDAIVAAAKHKLSNARMEAINNKIKLVIRTAYGFRNTDNMISMVLLTCSGVHITLPGR